MKFIRLKYIFGHLGTILRHRHCVIRHCFRCGIGFQGLFHDLSKFSATEFMQGIRYYQGYRSPNDREREINGYSLAWIHHKGRNRHHFEYWTDYCPKTRIMKPVQMPVRYVAEMFCDRVAASKIYNKKAYTDRDSIEYFNKGKKTRVIHPATSDLLEGWLVMLAEKGEKTTFAVIRKAVREAKRSKQPPVDAEQ